VTSIPGRHPDERGEQTPSTKSRVDNASVTTISPRRPIMTSAPPVAEPSASIRHGVRHDLDEKAVAAVAVRCGSI